MSWASSPAWAAHPGYDFITGHDFGFFLREPSLVPATTVTQFGGSDDDRLDGTSGNDLLVGNCGRDLLQGGSGDDVLFADAQVELPEGPGFGGATPHADAVGDFVTGGAGADLIFCESCLDTLTGRLGTTNNLQRRVG